MNSCRAILCLAVLGGCVSAAEQEQAATRAGLGQAYLRERNIPGAVRVLEEAVALDPRNAEAWQNLALAYMAHGALDKSEQAFDKALRLVPDKAETHNNYGLLLMQMDRRPEAIEQFQVALRDMTYRSPALAMSNLGFALYQEARYEEALDYLTLSIERAPTLCEAWLSRGMVYRELGDTELALGDFESAIERCGDRTPSVYVQAAELMLQAGDVQGGCIYLREAADQDPHSRLGREARERIARSCGRW